jgi:hypothetical protein
MAVSPFLWCGLILEVYPKGSRFQSRRPVGGSRRPSMPPVKDLPITQCRLFPQQPTLRNATVMSALCHFRGSARTDQ